MIAHESHSDARSGNVHESRSHRELAFELPYLSSGRPRCEWFPHGRILWLSGSRCYAR